MERLKRLVMRNAATIAAVILAVVIGSLLPGHHAAALGFLGGGIGMIIDAQTVLSSAQALTATAVSTNTFDMVLATNHYAAGEPLAIMFEVAVAADHTTGDETYQFNIIQSANADLSVPDTIVSTNVLLLTAILLVQGFKFMIPLPEGLITKRYLGVNYVLGGTTPLITINANLAPVSFFQHEQIYPKNFTISS